MSASTSGSPTGAASTSLTMSESEIVSMIGLISMHVHKLKGLKLLKESFHLILHRGVVLIGGYEFGCMLRDGGYALFLVDLEARNNFIYDGVGVVEAQFVNCSAG